MKRIGCYSTVLGIVVATALLAAPTSAGAGCNPTCEQGCKSELKACLASVKQAQVMQLAQCTMNKKLGGASCTFMSALGKSSCFGLCGVDLADCKTTLKANVAGCKASVKSQTAACKADAKDLVTQGVLGCNHSRDTCLANCP